MWKLANFELLNDSKMVEIAFDCDEQRRKSSCCGHLSYAHASRITFSLADIVLALSLRLPGSESYDSFHE